jgi:hypothetical protein
MTMKLCIPRSPMETDLISKYQPNRATSDVYPDCIGLAGQLADLKLSSAALIVFVADPSRVGPDTLECAKITISAAGLGLERTISSVYT